VIQINQSALSWFFLKELSKSECLLDIGAKIFICLSSKFALSFTFYGTVELSRRSVAWDLLFAAKAVTRFSVGFSDLFYRNFFNLRYHDSLRHYPFPHADYP